MFTRTLKLLSAVFIFTTLGVFAQSGQIAKVVVSDILGQMTSGITYKVTVTITNNSQEHWKSDDVNAECVGYFNCSEHWGNVSLAPGQSHNLQYNITPGTHEGKHLLKIYVYNGKKKIGEKKKKITVTMPETPGNKK